VDRAFANVVLSHFNACMALFSSLTSYALLVVLVAKYLPFSSVAVQWAIKTVCVVACATINIFGPDIVAQFSLALIVIVFVPFLLQTAVATLSGDLFRADLIASIVSVPAVVKWLKIVFFFF
jgi:hypothetical protein